MASSILETGSSSTSHSASTSPAGVVNDSLESFQLRKFSVAEYEAIGRHGIFEAEDQVELLEGWIVEKMTKNPQHFFALTKLFWAIQSRLPPGYVLRNQEPIVTTDSCPEPDLAIARGRIEDFAEHHPVSTDVVLVIEVADSSLLKDRRKCQLYARGGLEQYWIVNLAERCLEIYSDPSSAEPVHYRTAVTLTPDKTATIPLSDSIAVSIPVCEFLPGE